jgi:hypothetical protein
VAPLCEISGSFLIFTLARPASGTTLNDLRLAVGSVAPRTCPPARCGVAAANNFELVMKIERFAGHDDAREALLLSIAGVTAIMLIANLILLILY